MGRGRAKAKQTKVARALKYGGPQTDLERLQAELAGSGSTTEVSASDDASSDDESEDDPYADDLYSKYNDDED
jgi:hypothetical protein